MEMVNRSVDKLTQTHITTLRLGILKTEIIYQDITLENNELLQVQTNIFSFLSQNNLHVFINTYRAMGKNSADDKYFHRRQFA